MEHGISKWLLAATLGGALVLAYLGATTVTWLGFVAENPEFCRPPECELPRFEFGSALFAISFVLMFILALGLLLTRLLNPHVGERSGQAAHGYVVMGLMVLAASKALTALDLYSLQQFPTQWWMAVVGAGLLAGVVSRGIAPAVPLALVGTGVVGIASFSTGFGPLAAGWAAAAMLAQNRDSAIVGGALATFGWALFVSPSGDLAAAGLAATAAILFASLGDPLIARLSRPRVRPDSAFEHGRAQRRVLDHVFGRLAHGNH